MLTSLSIQNFMIINQAQIEFSSGMTTITGETGAGKSILLDALALCCGARADSAALRSNGERADIAALFSIDSKHPAVTWLKTHDLLISDELILRRVIPNRGSSRAYINQTPVTSQQLRELSQYLLTIHSQHAHQALLQANTQRVILDNYGQHPIDLIKKAYLDWQQLSQQLKELKHLGFAEEKIALLRYQLDELNLLDLNPEIIIEKQAQFKLLNQAESIIYHLNQALELLDTQDSGNCNQWLHQALQKLNQIQAPPKLLQESLDLLNSAGIQVSEACNNIQHYLDNFDADPETRQQLESELDHLYQLARKHQCEVTDLDAVSNKITTQLAQLDNSEAAIKNLESQLESAHQTYQTSAAKLTKAREKTGKKLAKAIESQCPELGLPNLRCQVVLKPHENNLPSQHGAERIEWHVQTNPGTPMQPLSKVVSGGELSRISLAIQVLTAENNTTRTLIFDEVDVGIGGQTAAKVGHKLRELSQNQQVITITHQPQVAACGHHQLHVSKSSHNKTTESNITQLDPSDRIEELARMVGGLEINQKTRATAQALLAEID